MGQVLKLRKFQIIFVLIFILNVCGYSQITVQMNDIQKIFIPGDMTIQIAPINTVNIGQTGGSNIYDFSNISFPDTTTLYVDSVSSVPELIGRYPLTGITWGSKQSGNLVNNEIFEFVNNTMLRHGKVSVFPDSQRYKHNIPSVPLIIFPAIYNSVWDDSFTTTDTTFVNGIPMNIDSVDQYIITVIDGYGTLKIPGYDFECLRMKRTHAIPLPADKEYWYMTREGALIVVNGAAASDPDTGVVQIQSIVLLGESLLSIPNTSQTLRNFSLYQNYPNPFNPKTKIKYNLPKSVEVKIEVFNPIGQKIETLIHKSMSTGLHEIEFNAKNFPSGVYFYKIEAGGFQEVRKMVLLR